MLGRAGGSAQPQELGCAPSSCPGRGAPAPLGLLWPCVPGVEAPAQGLPGALRSTQFCQASWTEWGWPHGVVPGGVGAACHGGAVALCPHGRDTDTPGAALGSVTLAVTEIYLPRGSGTSQFLQVPAWTR